MSVQLRVVMDQLSDVTHADRAAAALSLLHALIALAPRGCDVEVIAPAGEVRPVTGVSAIKQLALGRRELAASWHMGIAPGVAQGLVHSPTLLAPLVRHDRVNDHHQVSLTLWDLAAWERPESLSKASVAWQRGMLKRAAKHADAIVVPSFAIADRLASLAKVGDRVRVIGGAPSVGFLVPKDSLERRVALGLPERYIALVGPDDTLDQGCRAAAAAGVEVVVMDVPDGAEPRVSEIASAAGLPERRVHVRGELDDRDRAVLLGGALALVATATDFSWPWRVIDALSLGVPVVAADSAVHRDVLADGGLVVSEAQMVDAVVDAVGDGSRRLSVLAADRAQAFDWSSSAERIWALHADL